MKTIILILTLIFANFPNYSQFQQNWFSRYDAGGLDQPAKNIGIDNNGNVYITGTSYNIGTGLDIVTIKYNSQGVEQWVSSYNYASDFGRAIAVDYNTGDVYVLGKVDNGPTMFVTIKYNTSGIQQWVNFAGAQLGDPQAIAIDQYSNVYVTGRDQFLNTNDFYLTVKYNSSGVQQWYRRYRDNDNSNDWALDLAIDNIGNLYVTGESNFNYATVKYDANGTLVWENIYNGPNNKYDRARAICVDLPTGDVYVTGASERVYLKGEPSIYNFDFATIKYDATGNQIWVRYFSGSGNSEDVGLKILVYRDRMPPQNANVCVTGYSGVFPNTDVTTIAYNSITSNSIWNSTYNGVKPSSMGVDNGGNIYIAGYTFPSNNNDFVAIQYNIFGQLIWSSTYNGPGNNRDETTAINVDPNGNYFFISGFSTGIGTSYDYTLIKYIKSSDNGDNFTNCSLNNYPNPFNPTTNISFTIAKGDYVTLTIYNILGKEVSRLIDKQFYKVGNHNISFNAQNLPSGVYFYKLISTDYTHTQKMLLIK